MNAEDRYPYLAPSAAQMAERDDKTRIAYIGKDRFVPHRRATEVLDDLEALFATEDAVRPQGRLLVGRSLMGKSTIFDEFVGRHPATDNPGGNAAIVPVLLVQYPDTAREGIYPEILASLNARLPTNAKTQELRNASVRLMKAVGVRVLLVDELHNLLEGSANAQRKGLTSIKYLMNALRRPVVCAGTLEVINAINSDRQMSSRLARTPLARFSDDDDFQELLAGFESVLPLRKPSNLADVELSTKIFGITLGIIGDVADLLNRAAIQAIRSGTECITSNLIDEVTQYRLTDEQIKTMV